MNANDVLDGMEQIVRNEMLIKGDYVSQEVDESKKDQICGGHKFCAIGSMLAAGGVKPVYDEEWNEFELPFARLEERKGMPPHLRAAYNTLNLAADSFIERHNVRFGCSRRCFVSSLESLFENGVGINNRSMLLEVIAEAREILNDV